MLTKTRKQGNSLTLTVPKEFNIAEGQTVEPELTEQGILYKFVDTDKEDDFFDFTSDILADLVKEGYTGDHLLTEFNARKAAIPAAFKHMRTHTTGKVMTQEELKKAIGL